MKKSSKINLLISVFTLFLTAKAFALPIVGTSSVKMLLDSSVPYTMLDLNDNTLYETFCLESRNYFTPGVIYDVVSVGDYASGGGGGASGGMDQVSDDTKWLYAAYMSNVFSSVAYAAQKVQNAIWYLEEEIGGSVSDWNTLSRYSFDASGWEVVAVNLSLNGADNQSQLVGVSPVPEPATMILFGAGLVGLAGVRFRRKK